MARIYGIGTPCLYLGGVLAVDVASILLHCGFFTPGKPKQAIIPAMNGVRGNKSIILQHYASKNVESSSRNLLAKT